MPYTPDSFSDGQVLSASHVNKLGTQHAQALSDVAASYATQAGLTANYYTKSQADARYLAVGAGTIANDLTFSGNLTFSGADVFSGSATVSGSLSATGSVSLGLAASPTGELKNVYMPRHYGTLDKIITEYGDMLAYVEDYAPGSAAASPSASGSTEGGLGGGALATLFREARSYLPGLLHGVSWSAGTALPIVVTIAVPNVGKYRPPSGPARLVLTAVGGTWNPSACKIETYNGSAWTTQYDGALSWQRANTSDAEQRAVVPEFSLNTSSSTLTLRFTLSAGSTTTLPADWMLHRLSLFQAYAAWNPYSLSSRPGDQYTFGLPQLRNVTDGRRVEFDSATSQKRGLGLASTNELNAYIPSGGAFKVRQDSSGGTIIGHVVTTSGDNAKVATRHVSLHLDPQNQNDTAPAGACIWNVIGGGGPAPVRWKSATSQTFRWLGYYGQVPADFTGSLVIKARLKVIDGGSSVNIQNWQSYLDVYMDGEDNSFSVANPDTFGSISIGTTWQTVTIKSVSMPGSNGAGSNIYGYFGPGANAVTWGSDVLCGGVWAEYNTSY